MVDYFSMLLKTLTNLFQIESIISITLVIIGSIVALKIGDRILKKIEREFDLNLTAHYLFKDLLRYIVIIIAIAWILYILGINLQSILISLGVVGIAIGFASKDIVSNFVSGLFVISDKKIKVGAVIEINGTKGTIRKVGFRNTKMINQDNYEIIIPNSFLSTNVYKIFPESEDLRLRVEAVLPYGMNLFEFKKQLDNNMQRYTWINTEKESSMFSKGMSEWGPRIEISYWIKEYKYIDCGKVIILENMNKISSEHNENLNNQNKQILGNKTNNKRNLINYTNNKV